MKPYWIYYHPKTAEIKVVSPVEQNEYPDLKVMRIDRELGLKFVTGEEMTSAWFVTENQDGERVLGQNRLDAAPLDAGEHMQVPRGHSTDLVGIQVTAYLSSQLIDFSIPKSCRGLPLHSIKAETMTFYLTKRNDPTTLVNTFEVPIKELIEHGSVQLPLNSDLADFSLFTSRVFRNYEFTVRKSTWHKGIQNVKSRVNKLTRITEKPVIPANFVGVAVAFHSATKQLELRMIGEPDVASLDDKYLLFLTLPRDSTVFHDVVVFDLKRLMNEHSVIIALPPGAVAPFGVAGYPLTEEMAFVTI